MAVSTLRRICLQVGRKLCNEFGLPSFKRLVDGLQDSGYLPAIEAGNTRDGAVENCIEKVFEARRESTPHTTENLVVKENLGIREFLFRADLD